MAATIRSAATPYTSASANSRSREIWRSPRSYDAIEEGLNRPPERTVTCRRESDRPVRICRSTLPAAAAKSSYWSMRPSFPLAPQTTHGRSSAGWATDGSAVPVDPHGAPGELVFEERHVAVDHERDELLEARLRLPAELLSGLRRIATQGLDLRRPEVPRVDH